MIEEPINTSNMLSHPIVEREIVTASTVRAIQPGLFTTSPSVTLNQRLDQSALAVQPVSSVPVRRIATLPNSVSPEIINAIAQFQLASDGVPRDQIRVPISPVPEVTDQVLFESAADPTKKFYVPRYVLGEHNVSGQEQFRIALEQSGQGGTLSLHLDKVVPLQLRDLVQKTGAMEIDHAVSVVLQYHLVGNSSDVQKAMKFDEAINEEGGLRVTLNLASLTEVYQVYQAMTTINYNASLVVSRVLAVAIPVPPTGNVISSATGTLRGTWLFNFDTGAEVSSKADVWWDQQTDVIRSMNPQGNARIVNLGVINFDAVTADQLRTLNYGITPIPGNNDASNQLVNGDVFAVLTNAGNYAKVQVLSYGYNINLHWVTYHFASPVIISFNPGLLGTDFTTINPVLRPLSGGGGPVPVPQPTVLYREVVRTLDDVVEPNPFVFPSAPYIFRNITTGSGQEFGLTRQTIAWKGQPYNYYQDQAQLYRFYYLPDSFKVARRQESPHYPLMKVRFTTPDGNLQNIQVTLEYIALAFVDPNRLIAAAKSLTLPPNITLPPNVTGPQLEPLLVGPNAIKFNITLPSAATPSGATRVDLQGIVDQQTMSLQDFRSVYDALFGGSIVLFQGNVMVNLGNDQNKQEEQIPFIARMNDLLGEIFDYKEAPDTASNGLQVTLQNAIESPIKINRLEATLQRGQAPVPGLIQGLNLSTPLTLQLKETKAFVVAPSAQINGTAPLQAEFDLSGVEVLPDKDAIWKVVLASILPTYAKSIHVQTVADVFQTQNPDTKTIRFIVVDFETGESVELGPDKLDVPVELHLPIDDYILGHLDQGQYRYRVTVIRNGGKFKDDHLTTDSTKFLFPNVG
jgi:hypothetical protein